MAQRAAGTEPQRAADPNLRQVLFGVGPGAKFPSAERYTYVSVALFGFGLAALIASLLLIFFEAVESMNSDYITLAAFSVILPVVSPKKMTMLEIVPYVVGLSLAVASFGASKVGRPLMMASAIWNGPRAHDDFAEVRARQRASVTQTSSDAATSDQLSEAVAPFFRFGASLGLIFAALLAGDAVRLLAIWAIAGALCLGYSIYRRRKRHREAGGSAAANSKVKSK